ncbi:uncharacterized protein LOC133653561 isoform X2 [Entelurus aequoreus]|uniref:uncharacterized protein LOC133653561 isoform X2 n=1 Tax=Entelurus aequoreus TaxID=161455 RepID=UPI002B1DADC8|nr:uncharacterized protein LOC133653561 isoform X2 [Entelurus aequoreus]
MDDIRCSGRLKRKAEQTHDNEPPQKRKKTPLERTHEYRENIKKDSEQYNIFRQHENFRNRLYRERRSEEAIVRDRELARVRAQRYRERKKDNPSNEPRKTRKAAEKTMTDNCNKVKNWRANLSDEKKEEIKRKRREAYAAKKKKERTRNSNVNPGPNSPQTFSQYPSDRSSISQSHTPQDSQSPETPKGGNSVRQARHRFRRQLMKMLPSSRNTRADVLSNGIQMLSPRSRQALDKKIHIISPKSRKKLMICKDVSSAVKRQFEQIKHKRSTKDLIVRRLIANAVKQNRDALDYFNVSRKLKKRMDSKTPLTVTPATDGNVPAPLTFTPATDDVCEEHLHSEQQKWSFRVVTEEPQPFHIKKEEEYPLIPHFTKEEEDSLTAHIKKEEDPLTPHVKEEEEDPLTPHNKEGEEDPLTPHIKEEEEDPLTPHIKEEEEEHSISQEGEHLKGLEEVDVTKMPLTGVIVKSEYDELKVRRRERRSIQAAAQLNT